MVRRRKGYPSWVRHSGIGLEFAAAVVGFTLIGYWIDNHYQSGPKGVLIGAGLGIIGGGYNLIRESLLASRDAQKGDEPGERDEE